MEKYMVEVTLIQELEDVSAEHAQIKAIDAIPTSIFDLFNTHVEVSRI
jgi:hypothetical protein